MPVGSTHRLLGALSDEGVVERTEADEWRLSYRVLSIAGLQLRHNGLPAHARPVLERMAAESGQTAFLATRAGSDVVYLDKVQTEAQVQLYVELGTRRPMHGTALGKAILAHLDEPQREELLASAELVPLTEYTITDPVVLREQLAAVRERGYATDKEEAVAGISCLAAPLFDVSGAVVAAISIAGTDPRLRREDGELTRLVAEGGTAVSQRLGHIVADDAVR
jgi:DNA-binding IclR family transcriptional regulator